jgi:isoleucyl-tRNA synthetase
VDLSAFYFDIRKDALYCDPKSSKKRNSCIKVLNIILDSLIKWFAPILSFTTEEIFTLISKDKKSVHLEKFIEIPKNFSNKVLEKKWVELKMIRDICNISIEAKRASKEIGSSLEANLTISLNEKLFKIAEQTNFSEQCITSDAKIEKKEIDEVIAVTTKAEGKKCTVCWKINKNGCERHPV